MMEDEATRAALEITLREALRDRDRANATISFLTEKLRMAEPQASIALGPGNGERLDEGPRDVGPVHVTEGEFYGMSQPKAAAIFLERAGRSRPQRTEAIIAALKRGGVKFGGKNPTGTFYAILARTPTFHNVGKSTWGLSSWYPAGTKKPSKANASPPPQPDDGLSPPSGSTEAEASDDATEEPVIE